MINVKLSLQAREQLDRLTRYSREHDNAARLLAAYGSWSPDSGSVALTEVLDAWRSVEITRSPEPWQERHARTIGTLIALVGREEHVCALDFRRFVE